MRQEVTTLQEQLTELWNTVNELRNQPPLLTHHPPIFEQSDRAPSMLSRTLPPLISPPQRILPQFHGPTSSTYGFDVAKSSLKTMGITQPVEEGPLSRERSQAASPVHHPPPHQNKDPIWLLDEAEAMRLLRIYDEEIHCMYPVIEVDRMVSHIRTLMRFLNSAKTNGFALMGMPGEDAINDDQTTLLKLVLAIALTVEGHGHSELGRKLFESARTQVDLIIVQPVSIRAAVLIILTATYHFQKDEEIQAWRFIGMAGRVCVEMGLHRRDSLTRSFPVHAEYLLAVQVFWVVYALDRRWSFGTGMPFSLQDSDIDPHLPEPDSTYPYLQHITAHNHITTKIWQYILNWDSNHMQTRHDMNYLDYQILEWYRQLPDSLKFDSNNLARENQIPDRKIRRLKFLMFLRRQQARTIIYRPVLHSLTSIMQNRKDAETVIGIAKETINTIINVDRTSDIYRTQQVCYNYFLVQALVVIFLAVAHAPAMFVGTTRQEFYGAIDLIKGFSTKAYTTRKLWKVVRGLKDLGQKIGQFSQSGGVPLSPHSHTIEQDAHSAAAMTMAGLAGHKVDHFASTPHGRPSIEMSYSPEDASQMGNELTALFEMAGAYGGAGQHNGSIGAPTPRLDHYEGGYPAPTGDDGGHGDGYNAIFGNEPEFSRIMNELL